MYYETQSLFMAAWRFNVHRRIRNTLSLFIYVDGHYRVRALLRRQRIDVGTYQNPLFPYALFRANPKRLCRQTRPALLVHKTCRHFGWHNANPRTVLHVQRRIRFIARVAERSTVFPFSRRCIFGGIPAFQRQLPVRTPQSTCPCMAIFMGNAFRFVHFYAS